jgi:hypothetical protein
MDFYAIKIYHGVDVMTRIVGFSTKTLKEEKNILTLEKKTFLPKIFFGCKKINTFEENNSADVLSVDWFGDEGLLTFF